jgi:hypothetical protein
MKAVAFFALLVLLAATPTRVGPARAYPPASVPGFANPDVTQTNIKRTVCDPGWTKTIRPPASYTNKLKAAQMAALKLPGKPAEYEEDHFISLEIGGNPRDPRNLWPEPYDIQYGARIKDQVEDALHRQVCAAKMTLESAQKCITLDWIACGRKLGSIK